MSNIKNGGLDQYGTEPFERQQIGTAGVEGVKLRRNTKRQNVTYANSRSSDIKAVCNKLFVRLSVMNAHMTDSSQ